MSEFALTLPIFVAALLATVDIAFWSVETQAAVSATDTSARVAASALGPAQPNEVTAGHNDLVLAPVKGRLEAALFATHVAAWPNGRGCPSLSSIATGSVWLCSEANADGTVTVRIVGWARFFLPPYFVPGWRAGGMPVNESATLSSLAFER